MCDIWKRDATIEIAAADLKRHHESIRQLGVEWVVISGGEPLMHRDLGGLCTFFRDLDVRLTLLTTGLLLTRRAAEVATFFDDVIISLDGTKAIHDEIRRVKGAFDLIESGVTAVRQIRPDMRITARTTVQKLNYCHLRGTVFSAKTLGLDGVSFLAADLTSEAFNRPVQWPVERQDEVGLSIEETRSLEDEIEQLIACCAEDIVSGYIAENAAKLRRIVTHFKARLGIAGLQSPVCNAPWVSAVIEANGGVRPCFFHRVIGNIHEDDLANVLNGEAARSFRRDLDIQLNPTCQKCVCSIYRAIPQRL
jgi:MoaA/NifB/PqqE/SkfB family radical SAM enzyme